MITELEVSEQPLSPGTYWENDFDPPVSFALTGEWYAVQSAAGFFDIQQDVGSPDVIAVQFANVEGVDLAADAAELIAANPYLTVLGSDASQMAGREGFVVEVENATPTRAEVLEVPAGGIAIDPGRRLWIAFFDTYNGVMAVMVGGSADRWEEALSAAEPVLETLTIGDGAVVSP